MIAQAGVVNLLLQSLSSQDFALIAPDLRRMAAPVGMRLHHAGRRIEKVYFPEGGIISIVSVTLDGNSCEVGIFGREGMSETATVLGTDFSPHEAYVQAAGQGVIALGVDSLNAAMAVSPTLRLHLLHYIQAMMVQLSSSISAAGQTIEQRLARWLLMCHDRSDDETIGLTHEFIGMMLNVRRAGVSEALEALVRSGAIKQTRGQIMVLDRRQLEAIARDSYGLAETEYRRLIGCSITRSLSMLPAAA